MCFELPLAFPLKVTGGGESLKVSLCSENSKYYAQNGDFNSPRKVNSESPFIFPLKLCNSNTKFECFKKSDKYIDFQIKHAYINI